jgi:small conductance mechanosensitive channel
MLLWLRPFAVGDYIEVVSGNAIAGRVREIGLFASQLETYDGIFVFAPNSAIWNFALRNHSRNVGRLVVFMVKLAGADMERTRSIVLSVVVGAEGSLPQPKPEVFVDNYGEGGLALTASFWVAHAAIAETQRSITAALMARFETEPDLKIVQITRTLPLDADPSRFMLSTKT